MSEVKAVMVGSQGVGKTSILAKFRNGIFAEDGAVPTIVDFSSSHFEHDSTDYILQLWDTAGQEKYRSISKMYYKGAKIVFVTVTAEQSASVCIKSIK